MEILQIMGIPQENTVMGIPLMEILQKSVTGIPHDDGDSPGEDCDRDSPDDGDSPGEH